MIEDFYLYLIQIRLKENNFNFIKDINLFNNFDLLKNNTIINNIIIINIIVFYAKNVFIKRIFENKCERVLIIIKR